MAPKARRYTAKQLVKILKSDGWTEGRGGKHVLKMEKEGERPITIPSAGGETLSVGLSQAILKQAGLDDDS